MEGSESEGRFGQGGKREKKIMKLRVSWGDICRKVKVTHLLGVWSILILDFLAMWPTPGYI